MPEHSEYAAAATLRVQPVTAKQRVTAAMNFRETDRVPRMFNSFEGDFLEQWRERHGDEEPREYSGLDLTVVVADETPWPTRAGIVEERGARRPVLAVDWGARIRYAGGARGVQLRFQKDRPLPSPLPNPCHPSRS